MLRSRPAQRPALDHACLCTSPTTVILTVLRGGTLARMGQKSQHARHVHVTARGLVDHAAQFIPGVPNVSLTEADRQPSRVQATSPRGVRCVGGDSSRGELLADLVQGSNCGAPPTALPASPHALHASGLARCQHLSPAAGPIKDGRVEAGSHSQRAWGFGVSISSHIGPAAATTAVCPADRR